jgi:glycosyltransferase involved in cell wall biosynthesis
VKVAVFHNLPPGGARRAAFELVRHTADAIDYDFYRITLSHPDDRLASAQDIAKYAREVFEYQPDSRRFPVVGVQRVWDIRSMVLLQKTIASDIDERGYDAVFVHHDRLTHAPALLRFLRTPSLYYVQEPRRQSFEYALKHRHRPANGVNGATRMAAMTFDLWLQDRDVKGTRAATQLVANSYHSAEFIWRAYGRHAAVSYLGVDGDAFSLGSGEREGLLAVGALDVIKGHDLVIEALGQLPPAERPSLTIAFDRERPGMRERVVALAKRRGVTLRLQPGVDDMQLVALYQDSLATVCVAAVEPFGLTTVESLACGTPVVALQEGGYREVVRDGENGFLADRRAGSLSAAIARVMTESNRWSPSDLRATVLPFFSWPAAAARFQPLLAETTNSGGSPISGQSS